jgi:hypothetical protein
MVVANEWLVCEGEEVTFTGLTSPAGYEGSISWSGGGTPATGKVDYRQHGQPNRNRQLLQRYRGRKCDCADGL